jgi:ribonuclease PH
MRANNRSLNAIRPITIEKNFMPAALGSCLIKIGNTHVICTANLDESVPRFLKGSGKGWIVAEYSMLPSSTHERIRREVSSGKISGRTHEIQRLISRSLRAAVNLQALGERQILIDCDVLRADGGTRCAAITGAYVALQMAMQQLVNNYVLKTNPIISKIAAISCGVVKKQVMVDLDYQEDSSAEVDANFIMDDKMNLIEVQASGEEHSFTSAQLIQMMELASVTMQELFKAQG